MKEKEMKEKASEISLTNIDVDSSDSLKIDATKTSTDNQMDEIQLFKLMMKREEQKKKVDVEHSEAGDASLHNTRLVDIVTPGVNGSQEMGECI